LDTKHCDADGELQQYFKTSAEFEEYRTYRGLLLDKDPNAVVFEKWWFRNRQGEYPPGEPSSETRDQYKPIIDRFFKGEQVDNSLHLRNGGGQVDKYVLSELRSLAPTKLRIYQVMLSQLLRGGGKFGAGES
jgi:hypothetical protein